VWCCGHGCSRCAACSIAAAVVAPCVGHCRRLCAACGVVAAVIVQRVGRHHRFCVVCGVVVAVIAQCVSRLQLLRGMGVVVVVVAQHVLSRSQSLHDVGVVVVAWCRRRGHCVAWASRSLHHVGVVVVAPCGCHGHICHAVCCGYGGCRRAVWCRSCSHCYWTTKEEVSRKKRKEDVQAGRHVACSHEGHSNAMPSRSVVGPGRSSRERATTRCVPSLALWPEPISRN
jgi:hypothetical protein